jgi:hypothetical protein
VQNEQVKLTTTDNVMVFITAIFLYIHVKQLLVSGSAFMLSALLGVWISMTIFDMYGRWRLKTRD